RWWQHRAVPRNFLAIRYEELRAEPSRWLGPLLRFLGLPDVNDSLVADAVEYASFENMQRMEATNHFRSKRLRLGDESDPEAFKVRRGKIGGYRDYLSLSDRAFLDLAVDEGRCPLLEPYCPG